MYSLTYLHFLFPPQFLHTTVLQQDQKGCTANDTEIRAQDISQILEIPIGNVRPWYTEDLSRAPDPLPPDCYIKRPSLLDYNPHGKNHNRLSHAVLAEVKVCELLRRSPHPNIAEYLGCLVIDGRIHGFCFRFYDITLEAYLRKHRLGRLNGQKILDGIKAGVYHMYRLSLAHNDLKPENIMLKDGQPVIIDFDCCARQGECPDKIGAGGYSLEDAAVSRKQNDLYSLSMLERLILEGIGPDDGHKTQTSWGWVFDQLKRICKLQTRPKH